MLMRSRMLLAATTVVALLAACQDSGVDKAGGETLVLQFATIDSVNNNGQSYGPQAFVDSLGEVSGGRLRVEVIETYGENRADAESKLIEGIASGDLDGGWPSIRAFADAGIHGLEVVEAPMTITSYDAEKALVTSPVADQLLARLEGSGVVGLSLAVGPLRRPFAAEGPLLGLEDWAGTPFRVYNSPVQDDAVRALGATPVNVGSTWMNDVRSGTLKGAEFDIAQYHTNGWTTEAGNVTSNVVLWPKVFVLSLSQERFDTLTEEQRGWVREAAERATQAAVDATYDETTLAQELCAKGTRFVEASAAQLSDLHAAVQPVIDGFAADPAAAPLLQAIQGIAADHPGTDQPDVPADCAQGTAGEGSTGGVPTEVSDIPEGVYRVELTEADVEAAGLSNADGWSGTWTLTIEDGQWQLSCRPLDLPGQDCGGAVFDGPLEAGDVRGTGDTARFVGSEELISSLQGCELPATGAAGHCAPVFSYVLTWAIDGDTLELTDEGSIDTPYTFVIEPWTRIG